MDLPDKQSSLYRKVLEAEGKMVLGKVRLGETFEQTATRLKAAEEEQKREARAAQEERERIARDEQERQRLMAMPPEYVITLVHGTQLFRWLFEPFINPSKKQSGLLKELAEGPAWIQQDGKIARYLKKALGWRVRIEPFRWKGYNTVSARAVATKQLRTHLEDLRNRYPDAHQVVIAHSHGGNVAFAAIDDVVEAGRLLGAATLATPFLTARTRRVEGLLDGGDAMAAALMSGFATLATGLAYGHGWSWWPWALVVCATVMVLILGGSWMTNAMKKTAATIEEVMKETKLRSEQVTIIRTRGDEAAAVIAGARVAGAFVDLGWRRFSEPVLEKLSDVLEWVDYFGLRSLYRKSLREVRIDSPRPYTYRHTYGQNETPSLSEQIWHSVIPLIGPILVTAFQEQEHPVLKWMILAIAGLYGLPALLALLVTLISVIPAIVFCLGLLPCGWSVPFAGPYLDMTAEPAPPGTWLVTQVEPDGATGLSHSKSYNDPKVHEHLAGWIRERAKANKKENCAP
jgi:hypothetical protein